MFHYPLSSFDLRIPQKWLWSVTVFCVVTPCSLERARCFGRTCCLHLQGQSISQAELATCFMLVSCLAYSLTCFSKTSAAFQWTTHLYIPEDITLHILTMRILAHNRGLSFWYKLSTVQFLYLWSCKVCLYYVHDRKWHDPVYTPDNTIHSENTVHLTALL
jgi:hypothetical protein